MGIAPILVQRIYETIGEINRQGVAILLVEQNANYALDISTRGYVLETGRGGAGERLAISCATTPTSRGRTWAHDRLRGSSAPTALYLLFVWLISAADGSWLSDRKGYGERVGLAFGLLLSAIGLRDRAAAAGTAGLDLEDRGPVAASTQA